MVQRSDSLNGSDLSSSSSTSAFGFKTPRSPSRSTRNLELPKVNEVQALPTTSSPRRGRGNNVGRSIFSDRYIPNRTGVDLQAAFSLNNEEILPDLRNRGNSDNEIEIRKEEEANRTFSTVLKAELFGDNVPMATANLSKSSINNTNNRNVKSVSTPRQSNPTSTGTGAGGATISRDSNSLNNLGASPRSSANSTPYNNHTLSSSALLNHHSTPNLNESEDTNTNNNNNNITSTPRRKANLFTYQSPQKSRPPISRDLQQELYSLSPVRQESQKLLLSPQKKPRTIAKVPYRVLDAPELSDDFYLNLVDWGSQDVLAVGLGDSVYLWDGATQSVDRLCNLTNKDKVTSLNWIGAGTHLAIGTSKGLVEIWDATKIKCVRTMSGHSLRVSALAWNEHILSSGSRDRTILNRDVRIEDHFVNKFETHKQEVCGLKWNVDENKLASGGNDNNLFIWDGLNTTPLHHFSDHTAAVKAIAWSPHQRGILASGGGTADKTIKTWNTLTGNMLQDVNTGSQVCNLIWSRNSNELVSTHGYSRNQIIVWKYPSMQQIAQLTGHTYRVLYLSLSPDGETIVTGAGDETLRFWNVFEKNRHNETPSSVLLGAFSQLR
ncbi:CDH1 [[Candida] subhashii]|uniref:CDH1 n=1 Tax=[Candida] subhashii TaxID=561895 RepID=A0A8J5QPS8_9ASCO|nr:CDH1 [[Candida] subhashii]KAG7663427.1 CDH1 [[Candida] subhashii]